MPYDTNAIWNLKYNTNQQIRNKNRHTDIENTLVVAKVGRGVRNESLGLAEANCYTGWINNKVLLYSTGDYSQHPVINYNGKECGN